MGAFPLLEDKQLNPRLIITLIDLENDYEYVVNYIKYNNRKFGGTRYEYRMTGVLGLIRHNALKPGDSIIFKRMNPETYSVKFERRSSKGWKAPSDGWSIREEVNNDE